MQETLLSYFPWMWDLVSITSCLIARVSASLSLSALLSMLVSEAEQEKIIKEGQIKKIKILIILYKRGGGKNFLAGAGARRLTTPAFSPLRIILVNNHISFKSKGC
jgi:hypothetical protein